MPPCRVNARGRSKASQSQTKIENQPQLATAAEIVELRQVVQQQAELMQKQAEEAKRREEELTCHQSQLFEEFMQRFPVPQSDNRAGPVIEQVGPEVKVQPPQPQ